MVGISDQGVHVAHDLPFTASAPSLTRFLSHMQTSGVPTKLDRGYLKSVGFKSGNDTYIVGVLKQLGFVSPSGTPEARWRSYRDKSAAPKLLARGIREAYADLFAIYPDAYRKDEEALRNWVRSVTEYDEVKVGQAVKTFQALAALADFESVPDAANAGFPVGAEPSVSVAHASTPLVQGSAIPTAPSAGAAVPSFNINIELHLPSTADAETYDKFFAAMKKHLFPDAPA